MYQGPGSQGAREPGSQGAREPRSQGAREPGSQGEDLPSTPSFALSLSSLSSLLSFLIGSIMEVILKLLFFFLASDLGLGIMNTNYTLYTIHCINLFIC